MTRPNGGERKSAPRLQLGVVEVRGVATGHGPDYRVIRDVRLDDRATRTIAAAGPAHGLGEQLVRSLRGTFVGQVERNVGRNHADQRDLRHVYPLRDEGRAHQHVQLTGRKRVHHPDRGTAPLDDVAI